MLIKTLVRTKILRPVLWRAIRALPQRWKSEIIRGFFRAPVKIPKNLEFKLAETQEELEQAFNLLYDEFVASGLMEDNDSRMRVTKYHALPGTAILIGKWDDEVICTLSIIHDSTMGLPIDSQWNIEELRHSTTRIAEISALAIRRGAQGRRGKILLPLCKFMYEYCVLTGIDMLVISTAETVKDFYRAILLFKPVGNGKSVRYQFVRGVKAVAQYLDLRTAPQTYKKLYGERALDRNLFHFFMQLKFENFKFPTLRSGACVYPVMTPDMLEYFFKQKLSIFSGLTKEETSLLRNVYFYEPYTAVVGGESLAQSRRAKRLPANCRGQLIDFDQDRFQSVSIFDVSAFGVGAKLSQGVELNRPLRLRLETSDQRTMQLDVVPVWTDRFARYGFQIVRAPSLLWKEFINDLEAAYDPQLRVSKSRSQATG